ncbi:MAG TPA: AAA family ATPase [Actinomycetota bacterium]|nr:AAA family ATPase [Actinomycetota bacterium]
MSNGKGTNILADRPSRPRASERQTRAPAVLWDRIKLLIFLGVLWLAGLAVVWSTTVRPLDGPFVDAVRIAVNDYWWLLALMALEFVRQVHYFIEERSKGYYRFWQQSVFGGTERRLGKMNDYTRYRAGRAFKFVLFLLVFSTLLGRIFDTDPVWLGIVEAPARLVVALPFILQLAFGFFFVMFQFIGLFWFLSRGGIDTIMPDEIETRFDDVKGQDAALGQLKETLVFLDDPEAIESRGGYVPGGILLWGPPGTGKTLMAQAVAGETAKPFVNVDAGAFINMFMGVGILKVRSLYRKLRKLSMRYGGAIVFIDEADSLGSRGQQVATGFAPVSPWSTRPSCNGVSYLSAAGRDAAFHAGPASGEPGAPYKEQVFMGGMAGGGGMGTLQALLAEMSGLTKPKGLVNKIRKLLGMKPKPPPKYRILHIFATNMPNVLDPAMMRPGRVDRQYKVGYPQKDGRRATFEYYLAKVKNDLSSEEIDKLATITPYFSGASIKDIVNEGLVIAIRDDRDTVSYADVVKAKQLKQHGLPDEHEYIERERHSVAVHEACHAVVAYRLRKHAVIDMATIERRGDVGGFVSSIPPEDQFVQWRSEREIDVMTALASLAGERMFFDGDHSMGVGGDMRAATGMTSQALAYYAMGDRFASRSVTLAPLGSMSMETGGDRAMFDSAFGQSVEDKLAELYERTSSLLEQNRAEVLALAHALETVKTITGDDVEAIIEGTPGPTVDGRPYHDPAFAQMLERYHEAVLRAHRDHAGVESRIPVPVPPPPIEVSAAGGNGQAERPQLMLRPPSPPRPDDAER